MKRIATVVLLLCTVLMVSALDKSQTKINSIKKSKEYLYSDITMSTQEDATSQAFEVLQQEIRAWVTARADKTIDQYPSPVEINKLIDTMMVRRADKYRVFAYVKKFSLVSLFSKWDIVMLDQYDSDNPNVTGRLPNHVEAKPDGNPQAGQTKEAPNDTLANEGIRTLLKNNFLGRKDGVIDQIKKAKNFFELKEIMEPLKEKGEIVDFGKYATAKKPEDCYLVVYDPAGNIKALLGKGDEVRQNLKTGKDDSIKNYRGCGAIWFLLKDK